MTAGLRIPFLIILYKYIFLQEPQQKILKYKNFINATQMKVDSVHTPYQ